MPPPDPAPAPREPSRPPLTAALLAVVGALVLVYWLRVVLLPFVFAAAIAFVTTPAVEFLSRRLHLPRWAAALLVYAGIISALGAVCYWAFSVLAPQARELADNAPALIEASFKKLVGKHEVHLFGAEITAQGLRESAQQSLVQWTGGPAGAVAELFALLMGAFLCLLLVLFFLISGPRLSRGLLWLVPPRIRPTASGLATRLRPVLFRYILGVFVIVLITSLLTWIVLAVVLHLPNSTIVALAVGLLETIPVLGPVASVTLLVILGVTSGRVSVLIGLAVFALAIRLFIDQVVGPIILGRAVRIHPAVVIFAMLSGGVLFGVLGVLLAVPVAAAVKVTLHALYEGTSDAARPSTTTGASTGAGA